MPGGVNSPVRAMRSIGRDHPHLRLARRGLRADRRRRPSLRRLGVLVGAAHPRPRASRRRRRGDERRRARHFLRRADRGRGRARGRGLRPLRLGRDGADDVVGDGGVDERGAPGARGDGPRPGAEVRGRLPRPRRRASGRGGLGACDAGHSGEPWGDGCAGGRHDRGAVERPRGARGGARRARVRRDHGRAAAGEHGACPARGGVPRAACASSRPRTARCWCSTR